MPQFDIIIIFLLALCFIAIFLVLVAALVEPREQHNFAKRSPYECGFTPFTDTRHEFDIRFFVVSLLFLIFDIEIVLLFPFVFIIGTTALKAFWLFWFLLVLLFFGFLLEWVFLRLFN